MEYRRQDDELTQLAVKSGAVLTGVGLQYNSRADSNCERKTRNTPRLRVKGVRRMAVAADTSCKEDELDMAQHDGVLGTNPIGNTVGYLRFSTTCRNRAVAAAPDAMRC